MNREVAHVFVKLYEVEEEGNRMSTRTRFTQSKFNTALYV